MQPLRGGLAPLTLASKVAVFAPTDVANLVRWYKADALTLNDGDAVSTWTDSSGNSDAAQAGAGTLKPTYKANIQNGLPIVRFDGGDYLDFAGLQYTTSQAFTVFAVAKRATDASIMMVLGATSLLSHLSHYSNDIMYVASEATGVGGSAINTATMDVYMWMRNLSIASGRRNGAQSISPQGLTGNINLGRIGGRVELRATGDIAEIIVYGAAVADADRTKIEAHLASKYGITLA